MSDIHGPRALRLLAARDAAKIADAAWYADDSAQGDAADSTTGRASLAADAEVDVALAALIASDEERDWCCGDDYGSWTERGGSVDSVLGALEAAHDSEWDDDARQRTRVTWYRIRCELTGEEGRCMVTADPPEPKCARGHEHDWQEPYSVLGGLKENPGVWSSGAGISSRSVCACCGAYRVFDSGAQDPGTGCCYTSTTYEDADDESIAWVATCAAEAAAAEAS